MIPEHQKEENFLDFLTGEMPVPSRVLFEKHLHDCRDCQMRLEEYRNIFWVGLPSLADEFVGQSHVGASEWSYERGEKRLREALLGREERVHEQRAFAEVGHALLHRRKSRAHNRWLRSNAGMTLAIAASLVAALGLANSLYRVGVKHGMEQARVVTTPDAYPVDISGKGSVAITSGAYDETPLEQLRSLALERDAAQASLSDRDKEISQLKAQIVQQRKRVEATEASFHLADLRAKEQTQEISSQRDDLARKLDEQQSALAATQKKFDTLQQTGTNDALRVASLENQIRQITLLLKDKDATIDEQQRMLAFDRDIRDLMSTRGLYFAEVWDVGDNGKRKKPFGRVFYTRGKSLIFYGYDLDQEPGVKNANTFQAWGMRGPDPNTALNLGPMIMYEDNSKNKHWMVRFDDPKALEQINAVFVTVAPNGKSRVPQGKQMLVTYLNEAPNHP